jgi:predicted DNA-binding transcriptional regulator AlpA
MTKVKTTDNTISINEACQQAGITRMTFYNWLKKGIPVKTYKQLNKQVLLDRNDWDKYLNILKSGLPQTDKDETEELDIVKKDNE